MDFEENREIRTTRKKDATVTRVSKETSSFRSARTTLHGSSVCGTGSSLGSLDTNRTTERTKLARESGHEKERPGLSALGEERWPISRYSAHMPYQLSGAAAAPLHASQESHS